MNDDGFLKAINKTHFTLQKLIKTHIKKVNRTEARRGKKLSMNNQENFQFHLLRIAMMQLMRGVGFDKSNKQAIDTVTDLYIKYLSLLVKEIEKMVSIRSDELNDDYNYATNGSFLTLQDITQAFVNLKVIKPADLLDVYGENPDIDNNKGMEKFKEWCAKSTVAFESRLISKPNVNNLVIDLKNGCDLTDLNIEKEVPLFQEMGNDNVQFKDWIEYSLKKQQLQTWKQQNLHHSNKAFNIHTVTTSLSLKNLPGNDFIEASVLGTNSLNRQDLFSSTQNQFEPIANDREKSPTSLPHIYRVNDIKLTYEDEEVYQKLKKEHEDKLLEEARKEKEIESANENIENSQVVEQFPNDTQNNETRHVEVFDSGLSHEDNIHSDNAFINHSVPVQQDMMLHLDNNPIEFNDFDDMEDAFQRRDSFTDHYDYENNF